MHALEGVLGQDEVISSIIGWLADNASQTKLFVLRGRSGTGKTYIAKEAAKRWTNESFDKKFIHAEGDTSCIERPLFPLIRSLDNARKLFQLQSKKEKGINYAVDY